MDSMSEHKPLILLPGMGADARMFPEQQLAFPHLEIPRWIKPEPHESLSHYAARMVEQIPPRRGGFLGGASFGGVVALEMSCLLQPEACLLIGSLRDPQALPAAYRRLRGITGLTRWAPALGWLGLWTVGFVWRSRSLRVLRQLSDADGRFLSWATRALLDWTPSPGIAGLRVFQIHGGRDWVLPARLTQAEHIIPDAGHLLSLTHSAEVNEFLRSHIV